MQPVESDVEWSGAELIKGRTNRKLDSKSTDCNNEWRYKRRTIKVGVVGCSNDDSVE